MAASIANGMRALQKPTRSGAGAMRIDRSGKLQFLPDENVVLVLLGAYLLLLTAFLVLTGAWLELVVALLVNVPLVTTFGVLPAWRRYHEASTPAGTPRRAPHDVAR